MTDAFDKCRMHEKQRHHFNPNRNDSSFFCFAGFLESMTDVRCHRIAACAMWSVCLRWLNVFVERRNCVVTIIGGKYCVTLQEIGIVGGE